MKVLHLVSTFPPLTQTFVLREIRALRAAGFDVAIGELRPLHRNCAASGFEDLDPLVSRARWLSLDLLRALAFFVLRVPSRVLACLGIVLNSLSRPQYALKVIYILLSSMRLAYRFQNAEIELVQADFLHTEALAARFLKSLLGLPYSLTVYTVFTHYPRRVIDELVGGASLLVADTIQAREFLETKGVRPERIHVIRNGVSMSEFPQRSGREISGPPIILGVGSLVPKKGFHVLLSACALLRQRGAEFRCVIIGDGGERKRLDDLIEELGLSGLVEMVGYVSLSELRTWYYRAAVFAMPSIVTVEGQTDGLPTVVIEAMASGLPVVGTETAGIPEVIRDGVNGFLVPVNAPEPMTDRIRTLLERKDLRESFGSEGRRLIEREFSLERKVVALCELILGGATSKSAPELTKPFVEAVL
jgi:colanic acid/amylovoran biosynthesis glycosyltransferase